MTDIHKQVREWLNRNQSRGIRLLQKLVQEASLRGSESSGQAIVIEKCRELGLDLDIWEIGKTNLVEHPYFCSDRKDFSGNPNVVAVWKGSGGGKSIILNGHIDVVPVGDRDSWKHDPFSGFIKEGKLYGRGSTDMKGGNTALLLAIEALQATGVQLKGDIIFQSVIEEESGGAGTLAAVLRGFKADGAIIPEPTNMKFFPKQQGSMWFRIEVSGKSAHGGTRYEGVSAIEQAMKVISAIGQLEKSRNDRMKDPLYDSIPIPIPINIGKIYGGEWPSSVPDLVTIEGRMGVAPGEKMKNAEKELEKCLQRLASEDASFNTYPVKLEWFGGRWLPGELETEHPLMEVLTHSYKEVIGDEPVVEASPWGTDGGILSNIAGVPVVVFGPGTTSVAHDVNEYIELKNVFKTAEVIAHFLVNWCEIYDQEEGELN